MSEVESSNNPAIVSLAHGADIRKTTRNAINQLGGMKKFVKKGDKVFITPNLKLPTQHSVTSGDVLFTVVEMCQEAGAGEIIISDIPSISLSSNLSFRLINFDDMAKRMGVRYLYLKDAGIEDFEWIDIPEAKSIHKLKLHKELISSDTFISIPLASTDPITQVNLSLQLIKRIADNENRWKNQVVTPEFGKSITWEFMDIMKTRAKPDLVVVDAWYIVQWHNSWASPVPPVLGRKCRIPIIKKDLILAGSDPIAVDTVTSYIMGFDPLKEIDIINYANQKGIGVGDISKINIIGESPEDHKFKAMRINLNIELKSIEPYLKILKGEICKVCCLEVVKLLTDLLKSFGLKSLIESYNKGHPLVLLVGENPPEPPPGAIIGVIGDCAVCSTQNYRFRKNKFYRLGLFKKVPAYIDQWGCPPFRFNHSNINRLGRGLKGAVPLLENIASLSNLMKKWKFLTPEKEVVNHRFDYDLEFKERYDKEIRQLKRVL